MTKYRTLLNNIYCLSQEACNTIISLRSISSAAKNIRSYMMYVLLQELKSGALDAFKALELSEEQADSYLDEMFNMGATLKQIYDLFNSTFDSAQNYAMFKKLEHQIGVLLFALSKLYELRNETKTINDNLLAAE